MKINEVKSALGKRVRFRNRRLHCDGEYILTGCIIRRTCKAFYYQAELCDYNSGVDSYVIAALSDIEIITGQDTESRTLSRKQADNAYEMLKGSCNRMFVSDDPKEIDKLYYAALGFLEEIHVYGNARFTEGGTA